MSPGGGSPRGATWGGVAARALAVPCSSRVVEIQSQMSERAVELLGLPGDRPCLLLDVG